jgi:DNA-binding MarR family transcriptional regulator
MQSNHHSSWDVSEAIRASLARKSLADTRQRAAAAALLKLSETDVLAMQHLAWAGALTPSELAGRLRLTSGGVTALIHRLQRAGYATRGPHPGDRRSSLVRLSEEGRGRAADLYAPLVHELDAAVAALAEEERDVVARFLARVAELGESHAVELQRSAEARRPPVPRVPVPGLWS